MLIAIVIIAIPILVVFVLAALVFGLWWMWRRERANRRAIERSE
jgi:flagellar basal body-associated protein FliL